MTRAGGTALTPGSAAGAVSDFVQSEQPIVVEVALVDIVINTGIELLQKAQDCYASIIDMISQRSTAPISYATIKNTIDETLLSFATADVGIDAASQVANLNESPLGSIYDFFKTAADAAISSIEDVLTPVQSSVVAFAKGASDFADDASIGHSFVNSGKRASFAPTIKVRTFVPRKQAEQLQKKGLKPEGCAIEICELEKVVPWEYNRWE